MADVFPDIFAGLKKFFAANLTARDVMIGFPDERGGEVDPETGEEIDREYPQVSITLIDATKDLDNGYSGISHSREDNEDRTKATLTPIPIPIQLFFQLDTFCQARLHEWKLMKEILQLLAGRMPITTDGGRTLRPSAPSFDTLDQLEDGLFRKAYRFAVTAWLDNPREAEEVFLILETRVNVNDQQMAVVE